MEGVIGLAFLGATNSVNVQKRPRSFASRKPRADPHFLLHTHDLLSPSPALASDGGIFDEDAANDDPVDNSRPKQKALISINAMDAEYTPHGSSSRSSKNRQIIERPGGFSDIPINVSDKCYSRNNVSRSSSGFKRSSEGVLAPANLKSSNRQRPNLVHSIESASELVKVDSGESERNGRRGSGLGSANVSHSSEVNKLRKVKLKVGGVTHTIHTKSAPNSERPPRSSHASEKLQKASPQDKLNAESQSSPDDENDFHGGPCKDVKWPVRKSNRVPKRRVLDGDYNDNDEGDDDGLAKPKSSKASGSYAMEYNSGYEAEGSNKQRGSRGSKKPAVGKLYKSIESADGTPSSNEKRNRGRSKDADDLYSVDEDESGFAEEDDDDIVSLSSGSRRKKTKTALVQSPVEDKEISLTTRQRALQSAKDPSSGVGLVEFPDGLPLAAPKKQKDKLTDVEQQLKKAEAAQRRRMQVEKAARESEAQAIRKILGQDANGKKKEDKLRKRLEEMAQEKAARAMTVPSNTVRWTTGPSGTVVTFPEDVGLPSIFRSPPCSYPSPREKCASPSCTNTYKYRDSKSNLPLCSLQCYKAVNQMKEPTASCC